MAGFVFMALAAPAGSGSAAMTDLPRVRGTLTPNRALDDLTWLRVGGPADWLFQPADRDDLAEFLAALDADLPVFAMGVGSNLIVRDGGIRGVVIRMGRGFNAIDIDGTTVTAGAAALDAHVARRAAGAGVDLTFLRTIPGSIGGAVRMNAGCYGSYVAEHFVQATAIDRQGRSQVLKPDDMGFAYRSTSFGNDLILVEAVFAGAQADPDALEARMADQLARRDASQPTKDRTAGSTFRNPAGYSSTGQADDSHELKAWKVIEDAGLRGFSLGGAQMNPKHPNFLTNTGGATAEELEKLGEEVRKRVFESSGIQLQWEIMRVGEAVPQDNT
jgi:UDP-N-acetylmuramate dehydrogenase